MTKNPIKYPKDPKVRADIEELYGKIPDEPKTETLPAVTQQAAMIAPTPSAPPAVVHDAYYVPGSEELNREDMTFPRLILVQAQHTFPDSDKHIGEWYNDLTNTYHATLEAVVMGLHKTRVAFPRKFSRDSDPLCGSDDSQMPRAEYIGTEIYDEKTGITHVINADGCVKCPFSQFGEGGEPPLCAKTFAYAMFDFADNAMPVLVQASRAGMQAAKKLNTLAASVGRRKTILLSSSKVTSDTGSYYVPVFMVGAPSPRDVVSMVHDMVTGMGNPALRAKPEADETAPSRATSGGDFEPEFDKEDGGF